MHLMIPVVGRWVGLRGSDKTAIFEFLLFPFISRSKGHSQNSVNFYSRQSEAKREEWVIKLEKLLDGLLGVK